MNKVPNRSARGETMPLPDQPDTAPAAADGEGSLSAISPSPVPAIDTAEPDILSGPMTPFTPSADFDGYPDGKTKTVYRADVEAAAPANYVEHLRSKGLVAG